MIEKLYTVEEIAELAAVTPRTIRNYLKTGRLAGRKIGGQWRFSQSEVQRLLVGEGLHEADEASVGALSFPPGQVADAEEEYMPEEARPEPAQRPQSLPYAMPQAEQAPPAPEKEQQPSAPSAENPAAPALAPQPQAEYSPAYQPPPVSPMAASAYEPFRPAGAGMPGPVMMNSYPGYVQGIMPPQVPLFNQPAPQQGGQSFTLPGQGGASSPNISLYFSPVSQPQTNPSSQPQAVPAGAAYGPADPMMYAYSPYNAYQAMYARPDMQMMYPAMPAAFGAYYPPAPEGSSVPQPAAPEETAAPPAEKKQPSEETVAEAAPPPAEKQPELSDIGQQVALFASEVHDCSAGPQVCTMIDLHQSLATAKIVSERLAEIALQESEEGILCHCFVEFDSRYYVARYTLVGSTEFLLRCLKMIG